MAAPKTKTEPQTGEYEAMFVLDNNVASEDFEGAAGQVDAILEKHGAELVQKEKWDERKLAYEIDGHRRATYYLVYFRAPTQAIAQVDDDVRLNEVILRHLVLRLEEPIQVHIEKRAVEAEALAEDSRRASLTGGGERRPRKRKDRDDDDDDGDAGPKAKAEDGDAKPKPKAKAKADDGDAKPEAKAKADDGDAKPKPKAKSDGKKGADDASASSDAETKASGDAGAGDEKTSEAASSEDDEKDEKDA